MAPFDRSYDFLLARHCKYSCLVPLEERRNGCDLIEVFKMFYGYTEIGFYSRLMVMIEAWPYSKKICKPRFNTDIRKYTVFQKKVHP